VPPSRRRAKTMVLVYFTVVGAFFFAISTRGWWESKRGKRHDKALAAEWELDQPTFERISETLNQGALPPDDPDLQRYFRRQVEALELRGERVDRAAWQRSGQWLARERGLARLEDQDLTDLHALRKRVVFASDRACPCVLNGALCTTADWMDGLKRLPTLELGAWSRLSHRATVLETRASEPLPEQGTEFRAGMDAILERLDDETRQRIASAGKPNASKEDLCFAARAIYTGAEKLDEAAYVRFIRALLAIGAP
jgi:hypothetical protein